MVNRKIRISNGWAFFNSFSEQQFQELANLADGLEFVVTSQERFAFFNNIELNMETASLHLPALPEAHPEWYFPLKKEYPIETVVVHSTKKVEYAKAVSEEIETPPLTFENLDERTENRDKAMQVAKKTNANYTIDTQHLAETKTLPEAKSLIEELGPNIKQFHVSGRSTDERHECVINSENQNKIIKLLEYISVSPEVTDCPWVIEGKYETLSEVEKEVAFLRNID